MLFESFSISISYREAMCDLDISELHNRTGTRAFEVIQGGITIVLLMFGDNKWTMCLGDGLHSVVKQDTEAFVSEELIDILIYAIVNYYDCFTERKILWNKN